MNHALSINDVASLDSSSSSSPSYLKHEEHHPYTVQSPSTLSQDGDKSSVHSNRLGVSYTVQSPSTLSQDGDKSSVHSNPIGVSYTVQSPSTESQDGDKSSFPETTSPARVSSSFSSSGFSGSTGTRRNWNWNRHEKGWNQCYVIVEEKDEEEENWCRIDRRQWLVWVGLAFGLACLVIWGVTTPYRPRVAVESLKVNNFYIGQGSDYTGVPTKLLTINCTLRMTIRNTAKYLGMHISPTPVDLSYLDITIATGQIRSYYQPRKSERILSINLEGNKVPLYGGGSSLALAFSHGGVPLKISYDIRSHVHVFGNIMKTKHTKHISCTANINSRNNGFVRFKKYSCKYI